MKLLAASLFFVALHAPAAAQQTSPSTALGPDATRLNVTAEGHSLRTPGLANDGPLRLRAEAGLRSWS